MAWRDGAPSPWSGRLQAGGDVGRARRRPRPARGRAPPGSAGRGARPRPGGGRRSRGRSESGTPRRRERTTTLVPSSRRSGTRVTPGEPGQLGQVVGEGQVGVGHQHLARPRRRQPGHAGLHGAVQPPSRLGQHHGAVVACPRGHLGVVAHDGHRQGMAAASTRVAMMRASAARPAASRVGARRALAVGERLDRDEHHAAGEAGQTHRRCGHAPSVRARLRRPGPRRRVGPCSTRWR